jgi:hypothetical protein
MSDSPTLPADSSASDETEFSGSATYCPEDNKLRLYVGRVPRDEFLKLRAEGWTTLHKQRDAGGGDFVATWTPERRDTALAYAGVIGDEDMGPAERAADRAERFAIYREKRTNEATDLADRYEDGPTAHGFQSQARAERAAARHDRVAARACDVWNKTEYWTRRTAGVISHALYVSSPAVRMGRIKELEAQQRKTAASIEDLRKRFRVWTAIAAMTDAAEQTKRATLFAGNVSHWSEYAHPVTGRRASLYSLLTDAQSPITGAQASALYLSNHLDPESPEFQGTRLADWANHYALRLAYENQMMEAQGGRAGQVEMIPGGWIRGGRHLSSQERQIVKVNKSPATGRVVSVLVRDNAPSFVNHWGNPFPDGVARILSHQIEVERMSPDAYRAPTAEELAAFEAAKKAAKSAAPKKDPCPIINPTDADAERLVALLNERRLAEFNQRHGVAARFYTFEPCKIERVTQAVYSANSKGAYARAETRELHANAELADRDFGLYSRERDERRKRIGAPICKIRIAGGDACRVLILTDKPQKALPAAVWEPIAPAPVAPAETTAETLTLALS